MMLRIIVILISSLGVLGTLLPVVPGTPLLVLASLIYILFAGLEALGWQVLVGLVIMSLIAEGSKYFSSLLGAKHFGSSRQGLVGVLLGLMFGILFLGPLGIVLGPVLGSILVELFKGRSIEEAAKVGLGTIVGQLGGSVFAFMIALLMWGWMLIKIL